MIEAGIRRVVIACRDPFPQVSGGGISELQTAGIEVSVGTKREAAIRVMAPFLKRQVVGRPYVHAKWAMSLDGKIATPTGHSQWITNEPARDRVHQLRGRMDAIIVGAETARRDDPLLTARPSGKRVATRIVLDSLAQLDPNSQLIRTIDDAPVLVACSQSASESVVSSLRNLGVDVWRSPHPSQVEVEGLLEELHARGMTNVFVEGDAGVLGSFWDANEIDEVHVFVGAKLVGGLDSLTAVGGTGPEQIPQLSQFDQPNVEIFDGDVYWNAPRKHEWLNRLD